MGQRFACGFSDRALAEAAGVSLDALHFDVDAILAAHDAIKPVAERLGVEPPPPHIAGFTYTHIAALGAEIEFPVGSEPKPRPLIRSPQDIDSLREPDDYLAAPIIRQRLELLDELKKRAPNAVNSIGHVFEGPVTTAALILGDSFFTLPYDDPKRAHRLLDFAVTSALNYARAISSRLGLSLGKGPLNFPDDFAGMFPPDVFAEFVAPYWERFYTELYETTKRSVHSELLRPEHMRFLAELRIDFFDPGMDQYLTPEILSKCCPCAFSAPIHPWDIRDLSEDALEKLYVRYARCKPAVITFSMDSLSWEPKIARLLKVARAMED
ncbi:MAG: uroporphyrinogen decarboxylase family protein [Armatimonadota bacterium]|nr:uroporphyrinogen decarboxylase family protein [Armatimonadota bacterium]